MNGFLGRYEHQLDEKGRVSLPSAFRREAGADRFVLLQWEEPYLTLFPAEKWDSVQSEMLEYRRSQPGAWHRVRKIMAGAVEVVPDKQGRILVPAWLKGAASLDGTVLLQGNIDRVELWDPGLYESTVKAADDGLDDFLRRVFA